MVIVVHGQWCLSNDPYRPKGSIMVYSHFWGRIMVVVCLINLFYVINCFLFYLIVGQWRLNPFVIVGL